MDELYHSISWDEIKKSTTKLANEKTPGLDGVPPNTFKALDDANLSWLVIFYNQFWHSQADFDKWHKFQVVPVTKKGDTTDPNKWIGFALMDIGDNIYIRIMCGRLFKILSKHGMKCQFGYTPVVGCQDGTFTFKTLLHLRHNLNLPTCLEFADLGKAFDASNHTLLITILVKYGAPPRLCSAIKCVYEKIIVKLIIVKVETSIELKVVVKQGDIMAPVLFLFLMMAFTKILEGEWTALGLSKARFVCKDNSPRSTGQLMSHRPVTLSSGIIFDLFYMLYVDDGAFVFESRTDIEKGITLLSDHFFGSDL